MSTSSSVVSKSSSRKRVLVVYLRVSSARQDREGDSLNAQFVLIKNFALERGFRLYEIPHSDAVSAFDKRSAMRPGYLSAIRDAVRLGGGIIVLRVNRLSRSVTALKPIFDNKIPIYSVEHGGRVAKRELRRQVRAAEREGAEIGRQVNASARKKGTVGPRRDRRIRGAAHNGLRVDEKARLVAEYFRDNPDHLNSTWAEKVRRLNDARVLNLKSLARNEWKVWTVPALRYFWPKIQDEMELQTWAQETP